MGFGDDRYDDMKKVGQASRQNPGFHLRHKLWGLQSTCGGGTCEGVREIIFGPHFYPIYSISVSICIVYIQTFTFYFETGSHYVFLVGLGLPITPEWPWAHRHLPASAPASCYFLWETDIRIVLTPHQGNIPLQLSERVTEKIITHQNAEVWSPFPMDICTTELLHPKLRGHCAREGGKVIREQKSVNNKTSVLFRIRLEGNRKMDWQLNNLQRTQVLFLGPIQQSKTACNSSSRGSNVLFLSSWGSCTHAVHIKSPCRDVHTYMRHNY